MFTGVKRAMGYPCHIKNMVQITETIPANTDPSGIVLEDRMLNNTDAAQVFKYGYLQSYQRLEAAGGSRVGPLYERYSTYHLRLDCVSITYTMVNPTNWRMNVVAYEMEPRHDIPTLLAHESGVAQLTVYGAIVQAANDALINKPGSQAGSAFTVDEPEPDHMLNPIYGPRNSILKHHFKLLRKRKFAIESGGVFRYTSSYTPRKTLTGIDLAPEEFNGGLVNDVVAGQGIWMWKGLSRVIMFHVFGELISNGSSLTECADGSGTLHLRASRSYHFVAPQVAQAVNYTQYFNNTQASAISASTRQVTDLRQRLVNPTATAPV